MTELAKANDQVKAARDASEQTTKKLADALKRMADLQKTQAKEVADLSRQSETGKVVCTCGFSSRTKRTPSKPTIVPLESSNHRFEGDQSTRRAAGI